MKPELTQFAYSAEESTAISTALQSTKPWDQACVEAIRKRIKAFHLTLTNQTCCYCRENFHGEFQMVIDVEHILPSSKFKPLTFVIWNLSAACKRCNMWMKKEKTTFIDATVGNQQDPLHYLLIHPNFDDFGAHMMRFVLQQNDLRLIKYIYGNSQKAAFTYDFFQLHALEIDNFDSAQGANIASGASGGMANLIRQQVKELAKQFQ